MTVPGPTARPRGGVAPPATRTDRTRRAALLRRRRWTVGIVCAGLLLVVGVWVAAVAGHDPGSPAARPPARTTVTPRYTNPVIDHDFPDPDVVHTGSTYVALSTGTGGLDGTMTVKAIYQCAKARPPDLAATDEKFKDAWAGKIESEPVQVTFKRED